MTASKKVSSSLLENVHSYQINKDNFTIYMVGEASQEHNDTEPGVNFCMADRLEKNLEILSFINPTKPIFINMSTGGGYWEEGMQIFSAILTCPNPITIIGSKHCRSMSSIIPLAADKFLVRPPAVYMIHRGCSEFFGIEEEVDTEDEQRRKANEIMLNIYAARLSSQGEFSHLSKTKIRTLLKEKMRNKINVYLTSDEAVTWGFADGIFTGNAEEARATEVNHERRNLMMEAIRKPVNIEIKYS